MKPGSSLIHLNLVIPSLNYIISGLQELKIREKIQLERTGEEFHK